MKKAIAIGVSSLAYLSFVTPAFAATVNLCSKNNNFKPLCDLSALSFSDVVASVITLLLIAAVVIALIFLVWGGIKWILSGGDKAAVESARNHIVAALVGLAIALAAYFLLNLVLGLFGINGLKALELPTFVNTTPSSNGGQ